ncbi:hypothetical protein [Paraburkholderia sp. BR10954]|uniref:hypothetical protein n=1 Tax=Paraburkholderia sp. BR10954 TaxID=3236995 RepID=UPI0034D3398D
MPRRPKHKAWQLMPCSITTFPVHFLVGAKTAGDYRKGMAVFAVAKGGLMYEASIGGQKFSYKPR